MLFPSLGTQETVLNGSTHKACRPMYMCARVARRRGLTLMETALATIIVGLTVVAIVKLIAAVSQQDFYAQKTTTAMMLASNMRELMAGLPFCDAANGVHLGPDSGETTVAAFNDVEDFSGFTANPPIDANRQTLSNLPNWQQTVTIKHMLPGNGGYNSTDPVATDQSVMMDRVTVVVSYSSTPSDPASWVQIVSMEWLKSRY